MVNGIYVKKKKKKKHYEVTFQVKSMEEVRFIIWEIFIPFNQFILFFMDSFQLQVGI